VNERRIYDASYPLYASWSLESPIFTAVVFLQIVGNEVRAISSKHWKLKPLHACISDVVELTDKNSWRIRAHITPPDKDHVYAQQFEDMYLEPSPAEKISDTEILTRRLFATMLVNDTPENEALIESINNYSPREEPHGFVINSGHNLDRFFVRALEIFAAWRHAGGLESEEWSRAPDYSRADRARI